MPILIDDSRDAVAEICRRYGVRKLEVCGSILREHLFPGEVVWTFW